MKKNPSRKERRREQFIAGKKKGDLNRNSQHVMKTHMGMKKNEA